MFVRIVKMSFDPLKVEEFLHSFHEIKSKIRNFEGCTFLELYKDKKHNNIFFTYSYWNSEEDLERYRNSDLFIEVWGRTKLMFNEIPQAWSVDKLVSLE
ncbi:MAG: antibiotic biosynthesis monooxygenase family protein [Bacteroidota bacterium]